MVLSVERQRPKGARVRQLLHDSEPIARREAALAGGEACPRFLYFVFCVLRLRERIRGGGKVENLFLVFHFSIRLRRRRCGNVGISPAFGEISKGLVESVGSLLLAFHAFHRPGISTALSSHRVFRQRANKVSFAFCIRRAAAVSLIDSVCRFKMPSVIPSFKYFCQPASEASFS